MQFSFFASVFSDPGKSEKHRRDGQDSVERLSEVVHRSDGNVRTRISAQDRVQVYVGFQ